MRALILIGPPGAGKTSVLTALMNLLTKEDCRHAAIEVEALALVHPLPDDDAAFAHLQMLARSFGERGYPLLLVGATVDNPDYLRRLLERCRFGRALPGATRCSTGGAEGVASSVANHPSGSASSASPTPLARWP